MAVSTKYYFFAFDQFHYMYFLSRMSVIDYFSLIKMIISIYLVLT
ncbi:Uncharacterised protein [Klebsiella variicola]|nr:Uncharacterised protein [Klebsiella variicola]